MKIKIVLLMGAAVLMVLSGCSLFNSGKSSKKAFGLGLSAYGELNCPIAVDSVAAANSERAAEICSALQTNFNNAAVAGAYDYGKKKTISNPTPKQFKAENMKVLMGSCTSVSSKCEITIFVDKAAINDLRPIFVVDPGSSSVSCDPKYQAYIRSVVTLSKEAVTPVLPNTMSQASDFNLVCANMPSGRTDYLCSKKNLISSVTEYDQLDVTLGSESFSASVPATEKIMEIKFNSNNSANLVCIDDVIKPSLWGKNRASSGDRTTIGAFKITLRMRE